MSTESREGHYFLVASYDPDLSELDSSVADGENKDTEIKFQLSLRSALWDADFGGLYFAYTGLSHWQLYDAQHSAPFRTTDHEPELFWEQDFTDFELRGGLDHQSNGEGGAESRSWNRAYLEGQWDGVTDYKATDWGVTLRVWQQFEVADENEDIDDYLGHFELRGNCLFETGHQLVSVVLRNNLESENHGSFELDYSFELIANLRPMFQFFNGYGESLLDYNEYAHRIGFGFEFSP